jgi:hypothetical protein
MRETRAHYRPVEIDKQYLPIPDENVSVVKAPNAFYHFIRTAAIRQREQIRQMDFLRLSFLTSSFYSWCFCASVRDYYIDRLIKHYKGALPKDISYSSVMFYLSILLRHVFLVT